MSAHDFVKLSLGTSVWHDVNNKQNQKWQHLSQLKQAKSIMPVFISIYVVFKHFIVIFSSIDPTHSLALTNQRRACCCIGFHKIYLFYETCVCVCVCMIINFIT